MTTFLETGIALVDVAKAMKTTAPRVETEAREVGVFVGVDWSNRPAVAVTDAHALVSGNARRDHEHAAQHLHWRTAVEAWQAEGESVRRTTYNDHFDNARRRGVGDPRAAHEAAQAASAATIDYERSTPAPVFGDVESSRLSQMKTRIKEKVR